MALALLVGACLPATAAAAALAPVDLSAAGMSATNPRVGMDAAGGVVVAWQDPADGEARIQVAVRSAGGAFSAPVTVSRPGGAAGAPQLAVAASGEAVVVWRRTTADGSGIQAAVRPAGGGFAAPVDLAPAEAQAFAPQVAMAPSGAAVVAWLRFDGANTVVEATTRARGGAFAQAQRVSAPGRDALVAGAAVDSSGRAVVAWNRSNGRNTIIQAAAGGAVGFGDPVDLSAPGADAFDPQVALDPATGAGAVAWARPVGGDVLVQAATRTAAGGYSPPVALSAAGGDAEQPQIAVGDSGELLALWRRQVGRDTLVQARIRPPGGSFGPRADLSAPGADALDPRLAVAPSGRAIATWRRADPSDPRIQAATRAPGGAFGPAADVSERGTVASEPRAALDGAGNAVVVWRRADRAADIVQAAAIDEAPPVIGDVAMPPTAVAGQPVVFAASARDVWSSLAPGPIWTFGDGAAAVGGRVTHVFAEPGTYAVRVAQADALGNASAAERPIVITPRRPPGGGGAEPGPVTSLGVAVSARRPVALYARIGVVRRGARVHLRVRGRTAPVLAGRRIVVERRVGRTAKTLCVVRVVRSGAFHRLCRVDRLVRGSSLTLRVRARVGATPTTRRATLPYVTRRIVRPPPRGAAR